MTGGVTHPDLHVTLYVRSLRPRGTATENAIDRLGTLAGEEAVDSYDVVVWGDTAPPTYESARTPMGRYVCDRVAVFHEWARRNDVSLGPGLKYGAVDSSITGESHEAMRLPTLLAAAYRGDDLQCVAPHERDGAVQGLPDFLDRLAADGLPDEYIPVDGVRRVAPVPTPVEPPGGDVPDALASEDATTDEASTDGASGRPRRR